MPCACLFGPMAQSHNARPSPASPLSRRDPSHGSKAPLGPAIWRWRAPMKKAALQGRRAGRLAVAQLFVARAPYSQSAPHLDNLRVERLSSANLTMTIARRATQQRHCSASASLMRASRALRKTSALRKSVGAWDWHGPFGAGGGAGKKPPAEGRSRHGSEKAIVKLRGSKLPRLFRWRGISRAARDIARRAQGLRSREGFGGEHRRG